MDADGHPPPGDAGTPARDGHDPAEGPATLGGPARTVRFPPFWQAWFGRQTEARLAILDELVEERVERRVLRGIVHRVKQGVVLAFLVSAAAAHWFADQLAWIAERLPVLKLAWHLVTGGRP
ncbi:hypothetical protein [Methylobacterium aerolatum]|uniref:Uncharacterized protein n=1 Tax=Methylobacterium aerolatum TaxID=418708 RepID=A0ABU0HVM8_9HYPH|nr:hypothetical protein [Methylobacterium aerolatum]MDQ0446391.1 hypothetical protein [Methylobacterium aerolatum]GJD33446.1 hypothetical protein FMGBMHLM_0333 [Methylobacterium aerolatum]